jgi:2-polyprenyl-3-methyl-5-hydroxy-6-metoxy-1,4-benzoquinol methylase
MRVYIKPSNATELAALKLNLAPVPVGEVMFSLPLARTVMAGVRLGVFRRLVKGDATIEELAGELELTHEGARLLLTGLESIGHVERSDGRYAISKAARRWLDPDSDTYVGTFIEHSYDYWEWWERFEDVLRGGEPVELHGGGPDDPHWRRYIVGQFELARLSAPEVAKAVDLGKDPRSLLDVAGGHGWFSEALCRRHESLSATVVDLAGSAAVGRDILAEHGTSGRVRHQEGDMFETDLGGPHDGALAFNIIHHFDPDTCVRLLRRIGESLKPGGTLAVLDLFLPRAGKVADAAAFLGLFFHLTSGAATYAPDDLAEWLDAAGFDAPKRVRIRRIPGQTLYLARRK